MSFPLPNFFICGIPKCGTTSLFEYLSTHPNIFMSDPKEPWFFQGDEYYNGLEWYSETYFSNYDGEKAVGEATPGYFGRDSARQRIASDIPEARLIFVIRDPVDRLWSEYWWRIQNGQLSPVTSFGDFIRSEGPETNSFGVGHIESGMYYEHLTDWKELFSRDQIFVLLNYDLRERRQICLNRIFDFVGVKRHNISSEELDEHGATNHPNSIAVYNAIQKMWRPIRDRLGERVLEKTKSLRGYLKSLFFRKDHSGRPEMDPRDRAWLSNIYSDPNEKLADWLGRDLSHWT